MRLYLLWILTKGVADIVLGLIPKEEWFDNEIPMVWVDGLSRLDDPFEVDTFFDRAVSIAHNKTDHNDERLFNHETTGVFISSTQVLAAFNPYRGLSMNKSALKRMKLRIVHAREYNRTAFLRYYDGFEKRNYYDINVLDKSNYEITCARQVIPEIDHASLPLDMRHGIHSPLHDLMVMGLKENVTTFYPPFDMNGKFSKNKFRICESETNSSIIGCYMYQSAPLLTDLARIGDKLTEKNMKFASLAHLNNTHIFENRFLEKGNLSAPGHKKMIADCDEWIPREWGHFICLNNIHKYEGIASSALLFGEKKLFGIGAFTLWKGDDDSDGVLVFTDVRPYVNLLFKTCTKEDQYNKMLHTEP